MSKSIGYIYKIQHKKRKDTPVYFGSTTNLKDREKQHKYNCCDPKYSKYNYYVYQFIRDYGGWENWKLIKLNEILFSEKKELNEVERLYIKDYENTGKKTLNKTVPNRTKKEWLKDNPDKLNNILIRSRLKHREKANEYRRLHYHKNKERIKQKNKEYYEANKDKINKSRSQKWVCMCGTEVLLRNRKEHLKSLEHHNKSLNLLFEVINRE